MLGASVSNRGDTHRPKRALRTGGQCCCDILLKMTFKKREEAGYISRLMLRLAACQSH